MKNHHHNGPVHSTTNSREQIHEAIAARAYELWEKRGKPDNQSQALWIEAEHQLIAERNGAKSSGE